MIDLHAQHKALSNYDHLNRFGGRYRTVCAGLYRVARVLVVSILNDHGDIHTNRSDAELFAAVAAKHPDLQYRITALDALRPFLVRGEVEPFNPVGQGALDLVMELRQSAHDLLALAVEVREDTQARGGGTQASVRFGVAAVRWGAPPVSELRDRLQELATGWDQMGTEEYAAAVVATERGAVMFAARMEAWGNARSLSSQALRRVLNNTKDTPVTEAMAPEWEQFLESARSCLGSTEETSHADVLRDVLDVLHAVSQNAHDRCIPLMSAARGERWGPGTTAG